MNFSSQENEDSFEVLYETGQAVDDITEEHQIVQPMQEQAGNDTDQGTTNEHTSLLPPRTLSERIQRSRKIIPRALISKNTPKSLDNWKWSNRENVKSNKQFSHPFYSSDSHEHITFFIGPNSSRGNESVVSKLVSKLHRLSPSKSFPIGYTSTSKIEQHFLNSSHLSNTVIDTTAQSGAKHSSNSESTINKIPIDCLQISKLGARSNHSNHDEIVADGILNVHHQDAILEPQINNKNEKPRPKAKSYPTKVVKTRGQRELPTNHGPGLSISTPQFVGDTPRSLSFMKNSKNNTQTRYRPTLSYAENIILGKSVYSPVLPKVNPSPPQPLTRMSTSLIRTADEYYHLIKLDHSHELLRKLPLPDKSPNFAVSPTALNSSAYRIHQTRKLPLRHAASIRPTVSSLGTAAT